MTRKKPVLKLSEYDNDCRRFTVMETLEDTISALKTNPEQNRCNKALVILLDTTDGYTTSYSAAGLTRSEIIALLEVMKLRFLRGLIGDIDA